MKTDLLQVIAIAAALLLPLSAGHALAAHRVKAAAPTTEQRRATAAKRPADVSDEDGARVEDRDLLQGSEDEGARGRSGARKAKAYDPTSPGSVARAARRHNVEVVLAKNLVAMKTAMTEETELRKFGDGLSKDEALPAALRAQLEELILPVERLTFLQQALENSDLTEAQSKAIHGAIDRYAGAVDLSARTQALVAELRSQGIAEPRKAAERLGSRGETKLANEYAAQLDRVQQVLALEPGLVNAVNEQLPGRYTNTQPMLEVVLADLTKELAAKPESLRRVATLKALIAEIQPFVKELKSAQAGLARLGLSNVRELLKPDDVKQLQASR